MARSEPTGNLTIRVRTPFRIARIVAGAFLGAVALAAPAAARVASAPNAVTVYTLSSGRIGALVAGVVALIAAVIGGLAVARSGARHGAGNQRRRAIAALVLGSLGLVIGALVVATADGGVGTGNGLGGGVVAITVGLIGVALGGLALVRSPRAG